MKIIIGALLISISSIANAGYTDGNELQRWLSNSETAEDFSYEKAYGTGIFRGYVSGVVDVGDGRLFCTGKGVTRGQYTAVVIKYIKENPEQWNLSASELVINGLKKAFPCK